MLAACGRLQKPNFPCWKQKQEGFWRDQKHPETKSAGRKLKCGTRSACANRLAYPSRKDMQRLSDSNVTFRLWPGQCQHHLTSRSCFALATQWCQLKRCAGGSAVVSAVVVCRAVARWNSFLTRFGLPCPHWSQAQLPAAKFKPKVIGPFLENISFCIQITFHHQENTPIVFIWVCWHFDSIYIICSKGFSEVFGKAVC